MDLMRSWLFVPGRERMLERAASVRADAIVIDLEDAVPTAQKAAARRLATRWIPRLATARRRVFVRVNGLRSGQTRDDVMAAACKQLTGVVVPKVEAPQQLRDLDVLLREAEMAAGVRPGDTCTVPLIESARGLLRCEDIARASDRVRAISIGAEDYTNDLGIERRTDGAGIAHLRAVAVNVAVAYDLQPVDTPFTDHVYMDGLVEDIAVAKSVGMKGKYAIHPDQVAAINRAFTPTASEVAAAQAIIAAYEGGLAKGQGAVSLDGQMIDAPIAERARATIAASRRR